jgi:hypothetical protein
LFLNADVRINHVTLIFSYLTVRTAWKQLFRATWKDFNTHFGRLLENLRRHKIDIETQASLVEIERNQSSREAQERQFLDAEILERKRQAMAVIEKISPGNFELDQEIIAKCWMKEPNFGDWLLCHEKMKAWLDWKNADAEVLWVKGIPGAGQPPLLCHRSSLAVC